MPVRRFQSESYPGDQRDAAWRQFLAETGFIEVFSPDIPPTSLGHFRSGLSGGCKGQELVLARLTATGRVLTPVARGGIAPLILLPVDESLELLRGDDGTVLRAGELGLLPGDPGWHIRFGRNSRTVCANLPDALLMGRRSANTGIALPRVFRGEGIAGILASTIAATAAEIERLSQAHWGTISQQIADVFFSLPSKASSDGTQALTSAGLLGRLSQVIETHLGDNDLSAEAVARLEGISERYLQRLFRQNGETFSQYLRERRLQRARTMLSQPEETNVSVANVAYSCGFGDAANFNRLFKQRFGQPPGAFRSGLAESQRKAAGGVENRGWPVSALGPVRRRAKRPEPMAHSGARPLPRGPAGTAPRQHRLEVGAETVHWGYFSRALPPVLTIRPDDQVVIETLTQHATDAPNLMVRGDPAAEEVFHWDSEHKTVDRRGAGPLDASVFGRGAGEGFGVHICTGPIQVEGAEPGDVIEVHFDDISPRPSRAPGYEGRVFGSNVAAWWGYQYKDMLAEPRPRESVTIFEIHQDADGSGHAEALYGYRWTPQTDPFGVLHETYDYPGIPVDPASVVPEAPPERPLRVPLRPHFGVIALAPRETDLIDSIPPAYFGGNIDNWRLGKGTSLYLPVSVRGGLLSIGDPHAAQGDGEIAGTAIECSMTGKITVRLHKRGTPLSDITYPLIETGDAWILTGFSHPDYLAEFGPKGFAEVYAQSSLDLAMRDAFHKTRRFLMAHCSLTEDQAVAHMSVAVDFGVTQVVDGNLGVHAVIPKSLLPGIGG